MILSPLVLSLVLAADAEPAPKLPLGKDTTYVTGPLDKDGYIDYEAALNDRLGKDVTPERNANALLWKALGPTPYGDPMPAEFFRRLGVEEPPKDGEYFLLLDCFLKERLKRDPDDFQSFHDEVQRAGKLPWATKDYPDVAAWLEANEKPLAVVIEATRRPDYYYPLLFRWNDKHPVPWTMPGSREMGEALAARAMLRVAEGKYDDAWQDLLACHRLGRLVGRGGTLSDALMGPIIDILACNGDLAYLERADLTAAQLRDRLTELQGLPPMPPVADKIDQSVRFELLYEAQFIRRGGVGVLDYVAGESNFPNPDAGAEQSLAAIDWTPVLRDINAGCDRMAAALRIKDRAERQKELEKMQRDAKALKAATSPPWSVVRILLGKDSPEAKAGKLFGDRLVILPMTYAGEFLDFHDRDEQVQRNVQVAFALAAYHTDRGSYPTKLSHLAPTYLAFVPADLFSGQALIYRPSDKGYLLYSVGVNAKDDGGRSFDDDPPGDDLTVAMPLPELKTKK
jgi:hypothetical protein